MAKTQSMKGTPRPMKGKIITPSAPTKSFVEVKKWEASCKDQDWGGKLIGLGWTAPSSTDPTGSVEEKWLWTPPLPSVGKGKQGANKKAGNDAGKKAGKTPSKKVGKKAGKTPSKKAGKTPSKKTH